MPKLSYTTMATPGWTGVRAIKAAREYGYQGVDLRVSEKKGELTVESTDAEIAELRAAFDGEGIEASGLLGYNKRAGKDPDSWFQMRESVLRHLDVARRLGTDLVRIFLGNAGASGDPEDYKKRVSDLLASALEEDGTDTVLAIQNHGGDSDALDTADVIRRVGSPRLGMVFCPANSFAQGEDMDAVFEAVRPVTRQLYVADVAPTPGGERKHADVLPGQGAVPIQEAYRAVGGADFRGWVTFKWEKIWNPDIEEPEVALPYFVEYAIQL